MAQDILTESFDPIVELTTGADLMMAMVYAQELGDWDYSGMYTAVLKFKVRCEATVAHAQATTAQEYCGLP